METGSELTAHLTTGATVVYVLQWLKASGWVPWITADTKRLNRILSALLAAAMAVGINWTYDPTGGTLVITGLTWWAIIGSGYEWLKQFALQQLLYDGVAHRKG